MELKEVIKLWKKLKIESCTMDFNCGGDSMGDTSFSFSNGGEEDFENEELSKFFDDVVYNRVDFYVNSDGHYQGETGTVAITLNDDEDDFEYCKTAQSIYSESHTSETEVELSPKMIKFIKNNVSNINGGENFEGTATINFKREFIMTDEEEELQEELVKKVYKEISEYSPDDLDNDIDEWFTFTTNEEGKELTINGNSLKIIVSNSYTDFRDSD